MKQVEEEQQIHAAAENRLISRVSMVMIEGNDRRRYNVPLHEEVVAFFTGEDGAPPANRSIKIYPRNQPLHSIPLTSNMGSQMLF